MMSTVYSTLRHPMARTLQFKLALACAASLVSLAGFAHGDGVLRPRSAEPQLEQHDWGIAGDRKKVSRTLKLSMSDAMRFTPDHLRIKQGETIQLIIDNKGQSVHELVIGTPQALAAHAEMMLKHPDMEHDEPYMAHVLAAERGEIIWTFNRAGEFEFACLIAGHYQAGMVGKITVVAR